MHSSNNTVLIIGGGIADPALALFSVLYDAIPSATLGPARRSSTHWPRRGSAAAGRAACRDRRSRREVAPAVALHATLPELADQSDGLSSISSRTSGGGQRAPRICSFRRSPLPTPRKKRPSIIAAAVPPPGRRSSG
jgi:hypothetical protein